MFRWKAGRVRVRVVRPRDGGNKSRTWEIEPDEFERFDFVDGDQLSVVPAWQAALLPQSWGDRHVQIGPGRAIRVPPVYRFFSFKGFRVPSHLIALTGAGSETFDLIGGAHIRNYQKQVGLFPDMTFVDLGCGIGRDAFQLFDYLSPVGRYVGIDVTRDSIEWCSRHITPAFPQFSFHHFDAYNELYNPYGQRRTSDFQLPLDDASVDRIAAASVFTHLLEDEVVHYMAEFRRTLKPDGVVHASFFQYTSEAIRAAEAQGTTSWKAAFATEVGEGVYVQDPAYPRGAVAYSGAAMERMMRKAGLRTDLPYVKGAWSGVHGAAAEEGQDAIILRRN